MITVSPSIDRVDQRWFRSRTRRTESVLRTLTWVAGVPQRTFRGSIGPSIHPCWPIALGMFTCTRSQWRSQVPSDRIYKEYRTFAWPRGIPEVNHACLILHGYSCLRTGDPCWYNIHWFTWPTKIWNNPQTEKSPAFIAEHLRLYGVNTL